MPAIVIVLAVVGLAGITAGLFALRRNWLKAKAHQAGASCRKWFWVALALGAVLGIASWFLTYFMGYQISIEPQPGRIVGLPFFVAYFDSEGRDYVGPLTLPGAIANGLFWFVVPHLVLRVITWGVSMRAGSQGRSRYLLPACHRSVYARRLSRQVSAHAER